MSASGFLISCHRLERLLAAKRGGGHVPLLFSVTEALFTFINNNIGRRDQSSVGMSASAWISSDGVKWEKSELQPMKIIILFWVAQYNSTYIDYCVFGQIKPPHFSGQYNVD